MTKLPQKYRNILALIKFEDYPAFPAAGYLSMTADTNEPYFSVFLPKGVGYAWRLVTKWVYIDDLIEGYTIPVREEGEA